MLVSIDSFLCVGFWRFIAWLPTHVCRTSAPTRQGHGQFASLHQYLPRTQAEHCICFSVMPMQSFRCIHSVTCPSALCGTNALVKFSYKKGHLVWGRKGGLAAEDSQLKKAARNQGRPLLPCKAALIPVLSQHLLIHCQAQFGVNKATHTHMLKRLCRA